MTLSFYLWLDDKNIEIPVKTLTYTYQKSPGASDILICINSVSLGTLYNKRNMRNKRKRRNLKLINI